MGRNIRFLISVVDTKIKEKYRVTQYSSCKPMSSDRGWIVTNTSLDLVYCTRLEWNVFSLLKKVKIQVRRCQAVYIINTRPTCGWVVVGGGGVNRKQRTAPCCWHLTVLRSVGSNKARLFVSVIHPRPVNPGNNVMLHLYSLLAPVFYECSRSTHGETVWVVHFIFQLTPFSCHPISIKHI